MSGDVLTTGELVETKAVQCGDTAFLNYYDEIVTYKNLNETTNAFANYLTDKGVKKGDVVSYMIGNSPHHFYTLLGAQKIGAIGGPINCWWQAQEVKFLIDSSESKVLVVDSDYAPIISQIKDNIPSVKTIVINSQKPMDLDYPHEYLPEVIRSYPDTPANSYRPTKEDVAVLIYTAGTTGTPKGAMLTHQGIVYGAKIKTEGLPIEQGTKALAVLPLFHAGGLCDLSFPCMYRGATMILRKGFSASEFWECVERYEINFFYIVPTMWHVLLKAPESQIVNTSSMKFGISGAAPIPPEQIEECKRRFNIPILEGYGLTENTGCATVNTLDKQKHGSIGTSLRGIKVEIFDEEDNKLPPGEIGEIVIKGKTVMKEYINNPEETAAAIIDGWLHTGDVGYMDDEGFIFIVDRKKDMIIRGGANVYPKELENIVATHPKVDEVAVIPESDDKYGQVAKACVVLKRGETATEEELLEFCEKNMAGYKVPKYIIFRETLPKNALGKILKNVLIRELKEEEVAEAVPVAHFFEGMPERFIPEKAKGVAATISYNITGKGGGKWTITIKDGKMTLSKGLLKDPLVYIAARDCDYHDLVTGKIDGVTAVVTGKMTIEGDTGFMTRLNEMMKPL